MKNLKNASDGKVVDEVEVSLYKRHFHKENEVVLLVDILELIKQGMLKDEIQRIRELHGSDNVDEAQAIKAELP